MASQNKIGVCVAGISGWTGHKVGEAICASEDIELTAAVSRRLKGQTLFDVTIDETVDEALSKQANIDVLVDYTSAIAVKAHVLSAIAKGINVVIGSSGLAASDYAEIEVLALKNNVGVIASGNFSITAALAKRFSLMAAKYLPQWEIIDYSHAEKMDAPSGTTQELAEELAKVASNKLGIPIENTKGIKECRGGQIAGTPVHSIRLPSFILSFETIFGLPEERLTIRHDAGSSAKPYVDGTLLAVRSVGKIKGLVRGLDNLLFEQNI